eukprot:8373392-Ditylum_brightwellii.AAC.1
MAYLFENFPKLSPKDPNIDDSKHFNKNETVNLLNNWDYIDEGKEITLTQISVRVAWLHTYLNRSCNEYIQDIKWISTYLLNSMITEIQQSVTSMLNNYNKRYGHGGPLRFALMFD